MNYRVATENDLPLLRTLATPLRSDMDPEIGEALLTVPLSRRQVLIFEDRGQPVAFVSFALFNAETARMYQEEGVVDLDQPGDQLWVLEYSGDNNRIMEAHRIFGQLVREAGLPGYHFFRERDGRAHMLKV